MTRKNGSHTTNAPETDKAALLTFKPYLTAGDEMLRGAVYRRLIKACEDSGDETLRLLADDGVALWDLVNMLMWIDLEHPPFQVWCVGKPPQLDTSPSGLLNTLAEYMRLDPRFASDIVAQVMIHVNAGVDPSKSPPDMVGVEEKND